ncbi:MAG: tRNA epoxyqueuosine(34) reductase QueG [Alphaproteobacteria bacterium]|nr:tRNA epoxyqueuosine(34) reductase QueG [Alphaproteobacteria bacterium]
MRDTIIAWAKELGFDVVFFAKASLPAHHAQELDMFLQQERHGDMTWMQEHAARRRDPSQLWEAAKTAIILGHNYAPDYNPLDKLAEKNSGLISCYALNKDYHDVMKKRLKQLASTIATHYGEEVKIFVDTAPLMEKPLAAQTQLGWQGKHTCVVSREYGSWLFLGEILTTLEIPAETPHKDLCGNCSRCINICPTNAFDSPHRIDARKCISYLTIEHKGHIAPEFRKAMGNRIYGCDDCLAVCPWNKFAQASQEIAYQSKNDLPTADLAELLMLDDAAFRNRFSKSPVKRIKRDRFIRNVLIAAGNSGNKDLLPLIKILLTDDSPLVRAMAVWATAQLAPKKETLALAEKLLPNEPDIHVQNEWRNCYG